MQSYTCFLYMYIYNVFKERSFQIGKFDDELIFWVPDHETTQWACVGFLLVLSFRSR